MFGTEFEHYNGNKLIYKKNKMKLPTFENRNKESGKADKGLTILFFFAVLLLITGILLSL